MTRWYKEKKREHYYKEAKKHGYRARSAYKLKQIQKTFKIIRQGDTILDLGAAPGGWSQVAKELVGDNGNVVGVDLSWINRLEGVTFLKGDMMEDATISSIKEVLDGKEVDVVLSDMSPNISGNYSIDHARSIFLSEQALNVANLLLKKNGCFICKVFEGEDLKDFSIKTKEFFKNVKINTPSASRKCSSEVYIIARFRQIS